MNRKERRAAGKSGGGKAPAAAHRLGQLMAAAQAQVAAGQLAAAERLYREVLALDPRHIAALHGLSHIAYRSGHLADALHLLERAIASDDGIADLHYSIAAVLHGLGRLAEAGDHCARAAELRPDFPEAWFGRGNVLAELGQLAEAEACFARAVMLRPNYAPALSNRGNVLSKLGRTAEAVREWQRASAAAPDFPLPYVNLGAAYAAEGQHAMAAQSLRRALELVPDHAEAATLLARSHAELGEVGPAWEAVRRALALRDSLEARAAFVLCLKRFQLTADAPELREIAARALAEPWERPHLLAGPVAEILKTVPDIADVVARVAKTWPQRLSGAELWSQAQRSAICGDLLLRRLLESSPICDLELERFLTNARLALLDEVEREAGVMEATLLEFHCALARQCFINEYVYGLGADEERRAGELRARLAGALGAGTDVPPAWIAAAAAYGPLHALPQISALTAREWPTPVKSLITQQIEEPQAEALLRASIPALTPVEDAVSLAVRAQYEANPYPRWVKLPRDSVRVTIAEHLRSVFPGRDLHLEDPSGQKSDILVAGCGTGQHALSVALRYRDARVLAIDLSLSSLAYAARQAGAMGLKDIEFAQADILRASSLGRTFDLIETAGVLHHLDDPSAGWRALVSLLRPGGLMHVALYSALARQDVVAMRSYIAEQGYRSTDDDIRRFREDVTAHDCGVPVESFLNSPDFFSSSGCRDLLFHACERRLTIPEIKSWLQGSGLALVGFALEDGTLACLQRRFPGMDAVADLDLLDVFETENPLTFVTMYDFWLRRDPQVSSSSR